jgi:hypothetical protein
MARLHGINNGNGSMIVGNRVHQVGLCGIKAIDFSTAALSQNVVLNTGQGALFGGTKIGSNFCDGLLCGATAKSPMSDSAALPSLLGSH